MPINRVPKNAYKMPVNFFQKSMMISCDQTRLKQNWKSKPDKSKRLNMVSQKWFMWLRLILGCSCRQVIMVGRLIIMLATQSHPRMMWRQDNTTFSGFRPTTVMRCNPINLRTKSSRASRAHAKPKAQGQKGRLCARGDIYSCRK